MSSGGSSTRGATRAPAWLCVSLLGALCAAQARAQAEDAADPGAPAPAEAPGTAGLDAPPQAASEPAALAPSPQQVAGASAPSAFAAKPGALRSEVARLREQVEQAEEAALLAGSEVVPVEAVAVPKLRVYGFMDFGLDKAFFGEADDDGLALLRPTPTNTFVFGNLNLYFDARPVERVHTLVELRFTVAPHGEEIALGPPLGTSYERIDMVAFDFSSPSTQAQLRLGGLFIERAWAEYEFSELFRLQWGMLLTPFGIWNLDHGSPTLISLLLPTFIASQMVPTRLLGVHLYGSAFFGPHELGYAVHVSNGRSPLDVSLTEDKAVGGRLFWASQLGRARMVLGTSAYVGRYVDLEKSLDFAAEEEFLEWVETVAYDEQVVGFDAALDIGDFRLRSEAVLRWVHYDEDAHEKILTRGTLEYLPNRLEWDVYGLLAYRTSFGIEPYLQWEMAYKSYQLPRFAGNSRQTPVGPKPIIYSAGFNVEITSHTLFKAQFALTQVTENEIGFKDFEVPFVFLRVVSSF